MKVCNFGSLNLDHVYNVSHFVAAGETLSSEKMEIFCGGKGLNQSVSFAQAGAQVFHCGKIGTDGAVLSQLLESYGVDIRFVRQTSTPTGHAIIQVDPSGQNCILLYGGANREIDLEQIDQTLEFFGPGDLLMLQNEISGLAHLIPAAHKRGMTIAFNPSPIDSSLLQLPLELVDYFLVNEVEGEALSGESEPSLILEGLRQKYPNACILLTLGKKGAVCLYDGQFYQHGIYKSKVMDTTAAGDTFTGYFLTCLLQHGMSPAQALEYASKASSLAVSVQGAARSIPTMEEVRSCRLVLQEETI